MTYKQIGKNNHITIDCDATLLDGLFKLNNMTNNLQISRLIIFVVDKKGSVIGSLTDGDIRRDLVINKDLNKKVSEICNKNFFYLNDDCEQFNLSKFRKKNIKILPVLDSKKKIIELIDLENVKAVLPLECMIMAGGRGKRLSPLTDKTPKPLIKLGNKPIIEHNIDKLKSFGIKKFYISIKYLGEQIVEYFGDGSSKGIEIEYIIEDEPLGTAGSLSKIKKIKTENILITNSDLFTDINIEDMYLNLINNQANMAIASKEYIINVPYGIFESDNFNVKSLIEKPTYKYNLNAGVYILNKKLINKVPKNKYFDITQLIEKLLEQNKKVIHFPILGYWIDIGKPEDLKMAERLYKHSKEK